MQNEKIEMKGIKSLLSTSVQDEEPVDLSTVGIDEIHKAEIARVRRLLSYFYIQIENNLPNLNEPDMHGNI